MAKGAKAAAADIEPVLLPLADGGAGTVRAMVAATGGRLMTTETHGPLGGIVQAAWGILGDTTTAVIEMSAASGLSLVPGDKLDPLAASTFGTGELIAAAMEAGCRRIIIGLGDSATVDGGAGMAQALGIGLLDAAGQPVKPGGGGLSRLACIDMSGRHPLIADCEILCASDVTNPLYGENGAAYIYGPQKGATPDMVRQLDASLRHFAGVVERKLGIDIARVPGAGAAGGLGAGLVVFLGAEIRSGIELVCDIIGFDAYLDDADLVLTGEGRIDFQTAFGKTAVGIAGRAKTKGKPVIALCGELGPGYRDVYGHGIDAALSIIPGCMDRKEAMQQAGRLLEEATESIVRIFILSASRG